MSREPTRGWTQGLFPEVDQRPEGGLNSLSAIGESEMSVSDFLIKQLKKLIFLPYAKIRASLGGEGGGFKRSHYGVLLKTNWKDRTYIYCHFAVYGHGLSDYLRKLDKPFVFLDIGANQGLYSLIAGQNPHCSGAIALEPVPATFNRLMENIEANGLQGIVKAVQAALSDKEGTASIAFDAAHSGLASLRAGQSDGLAIATIDMVAFDKLLDEPAMLVVKVDVEGHEAAVMAELVKSRFLSRIQSIFYEVDAKWSDAERLRKILESGGFSNFTMLGRGKHYDVLATR
jgi:FkbM family methyltransferase